MGWVPPTPPPKPPWMSEEDYRIMLKREQEMIRRMCLNYSVSMRPYIALGLVAVPLAIVAIVLMLCGAL